MLWLFFACFPFRLNEKDEDEWALGEDERIIAAIETVLIPSGSFQMGCINGVSDCVFYEEPRHSVTISRDFYMMKKELTREEYFAVFGRSHFDYYNYYNLDFECRKTCPMHGISWFEAVEFANALSEKEGLEICYDIDGEVVSWPAGFDCEGWRLPTEAEWEYAAKGGEEYYFAGSNDPYEVGWYDDNSHYELYVGCSLAENDYGLCDMSGNLWEWTWDFFSEYSVESQIDPIGSEDGVSDWDNRRVSRGGSFDDSPYYARVFYRGHSDPSYSADRGIRLVRNP